MSEMFDQNISVDYTDKCRERKETIMLAVGSALFVTPFFLIDPVYNQMQNEAAQNPESVLATVEFPGNNSVHVTENPEQLGIVAGGVLMLALGSAIILKACRNRREQ